MFESLTEKLLSTLRVLSGKGRISSEVLDEFCRSLRANLLEADVHVKVVKDFIESVRSKCESARIEKSLDSERQIVQIVFEELSHVMGGKFTPLNFRVKPPAVFMVVGLQGAGKTTTVAKLAQYIKVTHKKSVFVASVDVYRPAAIEQLRIQLAPLGIEHFESQCIDSVRDRAILAKEESIRRLSDCLIIDTAGRMHVDEEMMDEISDLSNIFGTAEVLLVLDAMTGQDALKIANSFQERVPLTGFIMTKMDGDSRGGAALSVKAITGCPIKFIGTGEKPSDFDVFHPDRLASRILDMGDLLSLVEKAQTSYDPEESSRLEKKIKKNDFTLADFYEQLQQIKKMGSLENLMKFLPGMGRINHQMKGLAPPDGEIKKIEAIILSMTPEERIHYDLLDGSRRKRIASGSGTKVEDINKLMKQFLEARKMMTRFAKSAMGKRKMMW